VEQCLDTTQPGPLRIRIEHIGQAALADMMGDQEP